MEIIKLQIIGVKFYTVDIISGGNYLDDCFSEKFQSNNNKIILISLRIYY